MFRCSKKSRVYKRTVHISAPLLFLLTSHNTFYSFFLFVISFLLAQLVYHQLIFGAFMLLKQVLKSNMLYRLTFHRNKYHIVIYYANGYLKSFSYPNSKQAYFIFNKLTEKQIKKTNAQLNLF
jgi:hypothetical protein